ncbi:MAG: hypothetical protein WCO30_01955 [bacterium]
MKKKEVWFKQEMTPEALERFGTWLCRVVDRLARKFKRLENSSQAKSEIDHLLDKADSVLNEIIEKFGENLAPESFRVYFLSAVRRLLAVIDASKSFSKELASIAHA